MRPIFISSPALGVALALMGCAADAQDGAAGSDEQRTTIAIDPAIYGIDF